MTENTIVNQVLSWLFIAIMICVYGGFFLVLILIAIREARKSVDRRRSTKWSVLQDRHTGISYVCPAEFELENRRRLRKAYIVVVSNVPRKYTKSYRATQRLPEWKDMKEG